MTTGTDRRVVAAGFLSAFLLVAAFGNQWLWEDLLKKDEVDPNSSSHILSWLNTPHWVVDKSGAFAHLDGQDVAGYLLGVLALLLTVALVLGSAVRRADFNPLISGWFSLVLGGAVYGLTSYLVSAGPAGTALTTVETGSDGRTLSGTLNVMAAGGGYGLLAGWFVGIVCAFVAAGGGVRTLFQAPPAQPPVPPRPPVYPPAPGGRPY